MLISSQEVKRFYNIWIPLLHYVNQQKQVVEDFPQQWGADHIDVQDAGAIRVVLWDNDDLLDAFVRENPAQLSADDLAMVASWKQRVEGEFFIFRYTDDYAILLQDDKAYAVYGLTTTFKEMIGDNLPLYIKTVLIPFEDRIIYDTFFAPYRVFFGKNIRSDLNHTYRLIQEREGVTMSLHDTRAEHDIERVRDSNKKVLTAFNTELNRKGNISERTAADHCENIATFANNYLLQQQPPRYLLDVTLDDIHSYIASTPDQQINYVSLKRFARFMRDTGRMDSAVADTILDVIKEAR